MRGWIASLVGLVLATQANAATITESGDLPNAFPPVIGILDPGINTISGSIAGDCNLSGICGSPGDPTDAFYVTVLPGHEITAISLFSSGSAPAGYTSFAGVIGLGTVVLPLGVPYVVPITGTLGAGDYYFFFSENDASGPGTYLANWQTTVTVAASAAVPLPAAGWLMLAGLGALTLRRKPSGLAAE